MFRLNQDADINGSHRQSEVYASPAKLIERFGRPCESDGYKVSGEYIFDNEYGEVFTVYDWKCTTLYDSDYGVTPADFWARLIPTQFSIGGKTDSSSFVRWLSSEVSE